MSPDIRDWITIGLVLVAAVMCLAAGVGLLRMPDILTRLHAATKPQILGIMAVCVDVALSLPTVDVITTVIAVVLFQGLTAPISAHMVARTGYRHDLLRRDVTIRDDLRARVDLADE